MKFFRIARRALAIAGVTVFLGPLLIITRRLLPIKSIPYDAVQRLLYRWLRSAMGVKTLYIKGQVETHLPLVMMVNHISYVDILVLGSYLDCNFISKDDVRGWPIVGWVAKQYGTIFISRGSRNVKEGLEQMREALDKGKALVLFPEGTTSDGCRVLPFKSSYFELPEGTRVQPVSLRYSHHNGLPANRFIQKRLSWRGSEDLLAHLKHALAVRSIAATLTFHPSLPCGTSSRKELAKICYDKVCEGFEAR